MQRGWKAAAMVAALGVAGTARAHEFACEKSVEVLGAPLKLTGDAAPRVTRFPATLRFHYKLKNIHPTAESVANSVEDPLLAPYGGGTPFRTPMGVGVGEEREAIFDLKLESLDACQALAASDGLVDENFDSTFRVKWDLGESQASARVSCCEPFVDCEMTCPAWDPDCVEPEFITPALSRNAGFFKVHEAALQQCLASGSLDLGVARVESLESALGLLWASPGLDRNGGARGDVNASRFELAREALVGTCNERLFGGDSKRGQALADALSALRSPSGSEDTAHLASELKRLNEAGSGQALPSGFDAGRATPAHAASIAADPVEPTRK